MTVADTIPIPLEPPPPRPPRSPRARLAAALSFLGALVLALTWGFPSDRGWQFDVARAKTDRTGVYDLAKARMLARVVGHLRAHYVAPERIDPRRMVAAAMMRVQAEVPEVRALGLDVKGQPAGDAVPFMLHVTVGEVTREFPLDRVEDLYELNWKLADIFEFLERHLPPQVDLEALEFAAVNGLLATLDPHTVLLTPRTYRELQLSQKGRFGGLGITVGEVEGALVIQQVLRDTPAADAGLREGDRIVQIGGASTVNMPLDEAVNLLRGEADSEVTLWILRPDVAAWKDARPFKMVRREIQLPSVEEEALGDGIGWVHIRGFQETTDTDLLAALERLAARPGGLQGLVLDLRDNPGGLLEKAIAVSDLFLSRGTIVTTVREGGRERDETHAVDAGTRADLPLVVLVNRGSASASEIVAGALKRNDRALVLGQRTFGKGSVQVIYRIDDAALKLTVAQYLTPDDVSIQGVGIVPDVDLVTLRVPTFSAGAAFDGRMDLMPTPEDIGGEASLSSHLSSDKTRSERPSMTLRLLDELRTPTHRQRRGQPRIADATVALAKEILAAAPATNRKQALAQLANFFPARQAAEDQRLEAALAPAGVDWRAGPAPANGRSLEVSLALPAEVTAGTPFTATLEVRNVGKRPVARLHAELESGLSALAGRELAIGWVDPGKTVTRTLTLALPAGAARAGDELVARLYADGAPLAQAASARLSARPVAQPVFAHAVQIDDVPRQGAPATGNGDGLLQRGERVRVEAYVTNVGPGPAKSVLATLRNESGPEVFIHLGRQELGALGPGETARAVFDVEVRAGLKARLVELGLEVTDNGGTFLSPGPVAVELAVFPDALPSRVPATGFAALPDVTTPLHAGASRDTPEVAEVIPAAVLEVTGRVGDWLELGWSDLGERRRGFVRAERVRLADAGGVTRDAARSLAHHRPPVLELEPTPTFTTARDLALEGRARFSGASSERRMVYVFRGRDKVFFRALEVGPSGSAEAATALPFSTAIPLTPGRNEFTVIAREGEDGVARQSFVVFAETP